MHRFRHRHPHRDVRRPRDGTCVRTNPPALVWQPLEGVSEYALEICPGESWDTGRAEEAAIQGRPLYLPPAPLEAGPYCWRWRAGDEVSDTFRFTLVEGAAVVVVPGKEDLLARIPQARPRMMIRPEEVEALRRSCTDTRREAWDALRSEAEWLLKQEHTLAEPPYLPDWSLDYNAAFRVFADVLWASRRFAQGAETLALAYLASGDARFGRAAAERLLSLSTWNPEGSSHIAHNDEAHMPVMWWGPTAYDWVGELMAPDERLQVASHLARRAEITYHHCRTPEYGIDRFDSHAGRLTPFVGMCALAVLGEVEGAGEWLDWCARTMVGTWPVWAGDYGGWAEGISYSTAYVEIAVRYFASLRTATGVDVYARPFFRNHGFWRQYCFPAYLQWVGFGDHTERMPRLWDINRHLVHHLAAMTGQPELHAYARQFEEDRPEETDREFQQAAQPALTFLAPAEEPAAPSALLSPTGLPGAPHAPRLRVFHDTGWAAIRTDLWRKERDIFFLFRSSPYGPVSHSHANNNCFVLHVGGEALAVSSGYYDGYGSRHHFHWSHQTWAHNGLTFDGAGQVWGRYEDIGHIEGETDDPDFLYLRGRADGSYGGRCRRYSRHVLFVGGAYFLLLDEAELPTPLALQWNLHSLYPIEASEDGRRFTLAHGDARAEGHILHGRDGFAELSSGFPHPPGTNRETAAQLYPDQFHYRYSTLRTAARHRFGVLLCPGHASLRPARVTRVPATAADAFAVKHAGGEDLVLVTTGGMIRWGDWESDAAALLLLGGSESPRRVLALGGTTVRRAGRDVEHWSSGMME